MNRPILDSYWVSPGFLLAGAYPCSFRESEALAKVDALLDAGIRSFVDLTETEDGLVPYEALAKTLAAARDVEITYRRMAIRDRGIPSLEHMRSVLEQIDSEIAAGRPVYVHCWGGIGRTGTVVGCWMRTHDGCSSEEAIEKIAELRRGTPDGRSASPETSEQREFIDAWPAGRADPI